MHTPVLLNEIIEYLAPKPGDKFIDATIDGGGHASAILEKIGPEGKLLGIEWDGELLKHLKSRSLKFKERLILINDSYVNLKTIAEANGFIGADGILFDLGLSSWHLEESGRGFSFQKDERLNMRFSPYLEKSVSGNVTAEEIVNRFREEELEKIIKDYGEERFARSIARGIVRARKAKPIETTFQLAEIIKNSIPFRYRQSTNRRSGLNFATRTFQALRIAVNNELENINIGLNQAEEVLKLGGRLAVISFHSLEDRIAKNFFRAEHKEEKLKILTKKPIRAGLAEINQNPRARSAKLRVAEKTKN